MSDRRVGDIHAVKDDLPAGGMLQQVQAAQEGGFAADPEGPMTTTTSPRSNLRGNVV